MSGPARGGDQVIPRPAHWIDGPPPPWLGLTSVMGLDELVSTISQRPAHLLEPVSLEGTRHAAVLVGMFERDRGPELVFTRRTWHLRTHAGEVSFPGGRLDDGEHPRAAALREANEEIGLEPSGVEVIGELDHLHTFASNSRIAPVVGLLDGPPVFRINPAEVSYAFTYPLVDLMADGVYHCENWGDGHIERAISFFDIPGDTIWGATGRILVQLLAIATGTMP